MENTNGKWSDDPTVNPKTGIKKYQYGYWRFMRERKLTWWVVCFFLFWALSWTQKLYQTGTIGYAWVTIFVPILALFYVWYLWNEQKQGKTS